VITALGVLYGAFAAWRRNLRANIIAHRMCLRVGFVLSSTVEFRRHHLAGEPHGERQGSFTIRRRPNRVEFSTSVSSSRQVVISLFATIIRNRIESSQRPQELNDGLLVLPLQFFKLLGYMVCFAMVP